MSQGVQTGSAPKAKRYQAQCLCAFSHLLSPVLLQRPHLNSKNLTGSMRHRQPAPEKFSGAEAAEFLRPYPGPKARVLSPTLETWTLHHPYYLDSGLGRILTSSRKKPGTFLAHILSGQ